MKAYDYDELERLTEVSVLAATSQDERYTLDPEGNRIASHLSTAHVTDDANRLTSDDRYTYVYDLNGNLTGKLPKAGAPAGTAEWGYRYDALDQLISVTKDGVVVETYRYDAFGRRSNITTVDGLGNTAELGIINDGADRVIDVANDNTPTIIRRYTHSGNVDEPLQLETFDATGTFDARYSYHADHLGSIRFLTDALGDVVNAYDYDSYGRPTSEVEAFNQPFRYTGREWDASAELYHYRARAYDPSTGRFVQEDPIWFAGGDLNIYRYVGNNPLTYTDPSGLSQSGERAGTGGIARAAQPGIKKVGGNLNCLFSAIGSGVALLNDVQNGNPVDLMINTSTNAKDTVAACSAKAKVSPNNKKGADSKCPGKCFAAGTLVHTRDGLKPIEDIEEGDLVKSVDTVTGEIAYKPVTKAHINRFDPVGVVSIRDEADGSEMHISVTAAHPFYHSKTGWTHAARLKAGDKLAEDGGGELTVTNVVFNPDAPVTVTYNLEVADFHTYFVGGDGVLVHNGRRFRGKMRETVMKKNGGLCVRCGKIAEHADHIVPFCDGGPTKVFNGQPLCAPCNLKKGKSSPVPGVDLPWGR